MKIEDIARNRTRLAKIMCRRYCDAGKTYGLSNLIFQFEGGHMLALKVDVDSDEIVWTEMEVCSSNFIDLAEVYPPIIKAYDLFLRWCWEMKNHQGYFDALQIELTDASLKTTAIFQFKVVASDIKIFEVK